MGAWVRALLCGLIVLGGGLFAAPAAAGPGQPSAITAMALMHRINANLQGAGVNYAVEAIDFFGFGEGRPSVRIHQQEFRWVPFDERRVAEGEALTYLV